MKSPKRFTALIIFSLILIGGDRLGIWEGARGLSEKILFPVKAWVNSWGSGIKQTFSLIANYKSEKEIQSRIAGDEKENEELKVANKRLEEENESLRKQLEAPLPSSWKFMPVAVLGISRYLQIWAGDKDGIKAGMSVIDGKSLVGRINSVTAHSAMVILPTDPDINISSVTSRGSRGIVIGQFGEKVILSKVLQKDPLFLGDVVTTSGQDGILPGLLIGKVKIIQSKDFDAYKSAELESAIEYNKETTVFVVTGTQ